MKNKHLTNLFIKHRDFFDMQKTEEKNKFVACRVLNEEKYIFILIMQNSYSDINGECIHC